MHPTDMEGYRVDHQSVGRNYFYRYNDIYIYIPRHIIIYYVILQYSIGSVVDPIAKQQNAIYSRL